MSYDDLLQRLKSDLAQQSISQNNWLHGYIGMVFEIALIARISAISILIFTILSFVSCAPKHKEMPPGYKLICNAKNQYGAYDGIIVIPCYDYKPCRTRQAAIERAWDQYEYHSMVSSPDINDPKLWKDCP